ncbi:lamin tail domain-containing protein [Candidatus Woesearchaeota archaeon]|nr:lamin tail domain-containing protein [Candidatus Woesearchaeota archaeon]
MRKFVLCFLVFCFIEIVVADVVINEVMYNPSGDDNNLEYVEVYSDGFVNLTEWIIEDSGSSDVLAAVQYYDNNYSLIVEEGYDYSGLNASVYSAGATIGNNLNNDGDLVVLKDSSGSIIDAMTYSSSWGANGDDYTLEKINPSEGNTQDNWGVSFIMNGTPGMQNSIYGTGGVDYSVISISEFLPDPHGDDDAPMPQGEWIELYNSGSQNINLKWSFLKDLQGHTIYIADTTTIGSTIIPANGFLVVYTNGFSGFLNNAGIEELKFYGKDGVLVDEISYEGSDEGSSWAKVVSNWQRTMPTPEGENMDYTNVKDSKFDIEKIYDLGSDKTAKFGQTIRAKVNIYKGDETKSVLRLWVADGDEKISKESKLTISTKYTNVSLAVPIQLYPNCNEKYDDGDYDVFIGWTSEDHAEDSFPLEVEDITNSLCEIVKVEKSSISSKKFDYWISLKPDEVDSGDGFEIGVELENNDDEDYDIKIWSYVYRGNTCYSGGREDNKRSFVLEEGSSQTVKLKNTVIAEPGDYNIKVKIIKNDLKTPKEITETLRVIEEIVGVDEGEAVEEEESFGWKWREALVYESTSFKAKRLVPSLFIAAMSLLVIVLISTKN